LGLKGGGTIAHRLAAIVAAMNATPLRPEMHRWLERIAQLAERYPQQGPHGAGLSLADRRQHYRDSCSLLDVQPLPTVQHRDLLLPLPGRNLAARSYRPNAVAGDTLIVYWHGGGWVVGDLHTHDSLCRYISQQLQNTVISVDYRLAPEHRCPAACEDAADATAWLHHNRAQFGCTRLATAGDSAGAYLAAWAAHANPQAVQTMLLLYPVSQRNFQTTSYQTRGDGPGLTRDAMRWFWDQFVPDTLLPGVPPASLDLARLWPDTPPPAATLSAAWHDPLHDDATHLAQRLQQCGGSVQSFSAADMPHGYARYWAVDSAARAHLDQALAAFALQLQR
jgi:acetyl esterase